MQSPFPGMDPYLEDPRIWPGFHGMLIYALAGLLQPPLRPKYWASTEVREYYQPLDEAESRQAIPDITILREAAGQAVYRTRRSPSAGESQHTAKVGVPVPVEFRESYLEVHAAGSGELVTVIEVLSPSNKRPGRGRDLYLRKRNAILRSPVHLVEIDLLRVGERMPISRAPAGYQYSVLVHRDDSLSGTLYPFILRDNLPSVAIPLQKPDPDVTADLSTAFAEAYRTGSFDLRLNYKKCADPALPEEDSEWADALLHDKGLR